MKNTEGTHLYFTSVTAGALGHGHYGAVGTWRDLITQLESKGHKLEQMYGFFSPVGPQNESLVGEVTMIAGITFWTKVTPSGEKTIQILPPDTPVSFAQIYISPSLSPSNVSFGDRVAYKGFMPKGVKSVAEWQKDSNKEIGHKTNAAPSLLDVASESLFPHLNREEIPMHIAVFDVDYSGRGAIVRASFIPPLPDTSGVYPPAGKVGQHNDSYKSPQKMIAFYTNLQDRLKTKGFDGKDENVDVTAPHMHWVPFKVYEEARVMIREKGKSIYIQEHREDIDRKITNIVMEEKIEVGGHVIVPGEGWAGRIRGDRVGRINVLDTTGPTKSML